MTGSGGQHDGPERWVGRGIPRLEDPIYLRGQGRYVDDVTSTGLLHACFIRSPIAAASIDAIDADHVRSQPGVVGVFTAQDLGAGGVTSFMDRPFFVRTRMPFLAVDRVRFAGEPVAVVVAEDPYLAEDAAEQVRLRLSPTRAVMSAADATQAGAAAVHDEAPSNILVDVELGCSAAETEAALGEAHLVVEGSFDSGRLTAAPMEGRAVLAAWDPRDGRLTCYVSTQIPHLVRSVIAEAAGLPESAVHVVAPDVGGGFGQKSVIGREDVVVALVARTLRRSVKWIEDRRENLGASYQGHEQRTVVRAGFDANGSLLVIDAQIATDVGAYSVFWQTAALESLMGAAELPGVYRLDKYRVHAQAIATNKPPTAPYRGVGRPQVVHAVERLFDKAARAFDVDRAEIRRRNLIRSADFPYRGPTGLVYDRGTYVETMDACLARLGYGDWVSRQADARRKGRFLGLGFAVFSEPSGYGTPTFASRGLGVVPGFETAVMEMDPTGSVTVGVGASGHGQSHRTTFAQVVADELGIEPGQVRIVEGDTDTTPYGWGTFASRGAVVTGGACQVAAIALRDKLVRIAAHVLGAVEESLVVAEGCVSDGKRTLTVGEIARLAHHQSQLLPKGEEPGLRVRGDFDPRAPVYSNATHGAIVELDPSTGGVTVLRFVVAEDCGVMLNPMVVEGQIRGGVAQGIAKALLEEVRFDESGQCLSSSFIDYLIPTAYEIPSVEILHLESPAEEGTGAKGMGEGGVIGAPAAIANAVSDALSHLRADVDVLPIDPQTVRSHFASYSQES